MKTSRVFLLLLALVAVAAASWYWARRPPNVQSGGITVYYTKDDGRTEVAWPVSTRPRVAGESESEHARNTVLYAATQAVAGPESDKPAIRFPAGTHVLSASVSGTTATVDISADINNQHADVTSETGEFKALVWTLTALPGIDRVAVRVQGQQLKTLPGGHLELDEPLRRSDF
ncbi:MAG: GerMN domain-containing protein [Candidatus Baltobacteraceae bacterium]